MDLIYMNDKKEDIGVLMDYRLDLAYGSDENNFEITVNTNNHVCSPGNIVYIEGTEYGGIIGRIRVQTEINELVYAGKTWHGILESKIIEPPAGEDYFIANGEANSLLGEIIEKIGLSALFKSDPADSGIEVKNYKINRYIDGYYGIQKMLASAGAKLKIRFEVGKTGIDNYVVLSAEKKRDYSNDDEFDSSQLKFELEKNYRPVNHVICLGRGELKDRQVIHLYADSSGVISDIQTQFGIDEITVTYDNSNAESMEELRKGGEDMMKEAWNTDALQIDLDSENEYDIGDVVGAVENTTGIRIAKEIAKKIVTVDKGQTNIEYKVGEE